MNSVARKTRLDGTNGAAQSVRPTQFESVEFLLLRERELTTVEIPHQDALPVVLNTAHPTDSMAPSAAIHPPLMPSG